MTSISHFNDVADHALIEVMPHHTNLLEQMIDRDRVHGFGARSLQELLDYRIGGKGAAKTAFALTSADGSELRSVIYIHKTGKPITDPCDIPGDVAYVLEQPAGTSSPESLTGLIFYSISAFNKGAGPALIQALLGYHDLPDALYSTLSPLRTLAKSFQAGASAHTDAETRISMAYIHLLDVVNDVQLFHMGNGATIADIKTDANRPGTDDHREGFGTMVNYLYSPDAKERDHNRNLFKAIRAGEASVSRLHELIHPGLISRLEAYIAPMHAARSCYAPTVKNAALKVSS